jgi:hypothetical protein
MLSSIHPLGERGRSNRWGVTAFSFAVAATAGGAAVGALAGLLGALADRAVDLDATWVLLTAAGLCVLGAALDLLGDRAPLPSSRRQVDETWLTTYRGWVYGVGFGAQLGAGVVTIVTTAAVYLALVLAALTGSVALGATIGAAFGAVRGLAIYAGRGIVDTQRLMAVHRRIAERGGTARTLAIGGQLVAAALLVLTPITGS